MLILVQTKVYRQYAQQKIWWDVRVHPFYPTIEFRNM